MAHLKTELQMLADLVGKRLSMRLLIVQCSRLAFVCIYIYIYRVAACDVTGGVASLNFDATELQIF